MILAAPPSDVWGFDAACQAQSEQTTSKTLVITGDDDFICGPVCAEEICAGIPGARMVIVGDAGHMVFVEQPQAFHDEVADFLGG